MANANLAPQQVGVDHINSAVVARPPGQPWVFPRCLCGNRPWSAVE